MLLRRFTHQLMITFLALLTACLPLQAAQAAPPEHEIGAVKITILSTMLADKNELGEWGFSTLVEVDGKKILFDTGTNPDLVLKNARTLGIDLSQVEDVVISHNHSDHTGGLLTLRRELMKINSKAMSRVHVSAGIFEPRWAKDGSDHNGLTPLKADYEAMGGQFIVHDKPFEIANGVWLTGPVPRVYPETNWQPGNSIKTANGMIDDNIPEDTAMILVAKSGLVILTGCGHAGIVNIGTYAQSLFHRPVLSIVGGIHLFAKSDKIVDWTGTKLKAMGTRYLLAAHCTGIEATFRLRKVMGLTRQTAVVGATGASYDLATGINPGDIAK